MIDCLSNPSWISPQIDFLLFLQNIRVGTWEIFDRFFLMITVFGEFWLPTLICAVVYWCFDFRSGVYMFTLNCFNMFLTHLFKMLACVYRPWVLDNRIHPSELAVPFAKGYSFPSGHSATSSSVLGGLAFILRKHKIWCISLVLLVLLIGFSRLWLGVHTPQDVVVGLTIGFSLVFAGNLILKWADENENRYLYLMGVINVLALLALIYTTYFGTYRMDYVSGELLVNPQKLKYVTIIVYAYSLGLFNGCCLCKRFFPFNPQEVSVKRRIIRGIIGGVGIILLHKFIFEYIFMNVIDLKLASLLLFAVGISITLIYPLIFTKLKI